MRAIVCPDHGKVKPTPHEDAARGLFTRYVRGKLSVSCVCDTCGKPMNPGDDAVALTNPDKRIGAWESEYLVTAT